MFCMHGQSGDADRHAANHPAMLQILCALGLLSRSRYSNALCPVRPPQTAIGRPAGTLLGSAAVPVAVLGVASGFVPTGQRDNSPAFQRRVLAGTGQSPDRTSVV